MKIFSNMSKKKKAITIGVISIVCALLLTGGILGIVSAVRENKQEKCIHKWDAGKVVTAATCEEPGKMKYTCTKCDKEKTGEIKAKGHVEVVIEAIPATCLKSGLTDGKKCDVCAKIIVEQATVPALGHNPVVDAAVAPTCTETGLSEGSHCKRCEIVLVEQETVPAKGHTPVEMSGYDATCTNFGLTAGSKCSVCQTVYTPQEKIDALGHYLTGHEGQEPTCTEEGYEAYETCTRDGCAYTTYTVIAAKNHAYDDNGLCTVCGYVLEVNHQHLYNEGIVTLSATCTEEGLKTFTCACGEKRTEAIAPTGHAYGNGLVTQPSTCTTAGIMMYTCVDCSTKKTETIDPTGHEYDDGVVTQSATCVANGVTTFTCKNNCGATYTSVITATGHNYNEGVMTKDVTCTTSGEIIVTCLNPNCGASYVETLQATGHNYNSGVTTKEATCTEKGVITFTCNSCADTYTADIKEYGHTVKKVSGYAATCTATGLTDGEVCSRCGVVLSEQNTIKMLAHDYSNGEYVQEPTCTKDGSWFSSCSMCGKENTVLVGATGHNYNSQGTCQACGISLINDDLIMVGNVLLDYSSSRPNLVYQAKASYSLNSLVKGSSDKSFKIYTVSTEDFKRVQKEAGVICDYIQEIRKRSIPYGIFNFDSGTYDISSASYKIKAVSSNGARYENINEEFTAFAVVCTMDDAYATYEYAGNLKGDSIGYATSSVAYEVADLLNKHYADVDASSLSDADVTKLKNLLDESVDCAKGLNTPVYDGSTYFINVTREGNTGTVRVGETTKLKVTVTPNINLPIEYVYDESIFSISSDGTVTVLSSGGLVNTIRIIVAGESKVINIMTSK